MCFSFNRKALNAREYHNVFLASFLPGKNNFMISIPPRTLRPIIFEIYDRDNSCETHA